VDSCFFPVYEVEKGKTTINYDPDQLERRVQVRDWLRVMGKTKHLLSAENEPRMASIQAEVERRWRRLKIMHQHPEL